MLLKRPKKIVPTKNESNIKADDRVRIHEYSVWKDKMCPFATSTAYDLCIYQLSSRYYNLLVRIFRAGFVLIIESSWSALRNQSWHEFRIVGRIFSFDIFESVKKYLAQKIRTRESALYILLLENLPPGIYEYSYTRDRRMICRTPQ